MDGSTEVTAMVYKRVCDTSNRESHWLVNRRASVKQRCTASFGDLARGHWQRTDLLRSSGPVAHRVDLLVAWRSAMARGSVEEDWLTDLMILVAAA